MTDPRPTITREIVIVETTADGMRESWNPSDEEMLEMGFIRVGNGNVFDPTAILEIPELMVGNGRANGEEKA